MTPTPRSNVPGIVWPALPGPSAALLLALQLQLEQTQWYDPERLQEEQERQLGLMVRHAATTSPHYERAFAGHIERLASGAALTLADVQALPLLTREALVAAGSGLKSRAYPAPHGQARVVETSRSSGKPVRVLRSGVVSMMWLAMTLREHLWHRRDLTARLASIRYFDAGQGRPPDGERRQGWGPATDAIYPAAPCSALSIAATVDEQLEWLVREQPAYLLTYPSALDALLRRLSATGATLPSIREVRTLSETLKPETRQLCREVLGVRALASDGEQIYFAPGNILYTANPETGEVTSLGTLTDCPERISAMTFHRGELHMVSTNDSMLYRIDTTDQTCTAVLDLGLGDADALASLR